MKKLIFLMTALLAFAVESWASVSVNYDNKQNQWDAATQTTPASMIHVSLASTEAGSIAAMLTSSTLTSSDGTQFDASAVQRLTVTGPINADDLAALAKYFGSTAALLSLNLEGATLSSNDDITTFDGEFSNVQGLVLPSSITKIESSTVAKFTNSELAAISFDTAEGSSFTVVLQQGRRWTLQGAWSEQ